MKKVEKIVYNMAEPIVEANGFELVDVEYTKEDANWFLRIYIDKPGGITIEECEKISRILSKELDKIDPIDCRYFLEVSSPGLDRPIKTDKDLKRNIGTLVEVRLYQSIGDNKRFEGLLAGYNDENITIDLENETLSIPRKNIALIKPVVRI